MDTIAKKGIIPRVPAGRADVVLKDSTRVFSLLWQGSKEVIIALKELKKGTKSPEEILSLFFDGGSEDSILWCFVILLSQKHEDTVIVFKDLQDHGFEGVDDAYNWFFTNIYTKEKACCGRHDQGRKKPRTAA